MRPTRTLGGVALLLALSLAARAEPVTAKATVTRAVEVRSGPSDKFYSTSRLAPGDQVEVVEEKDAPWLAGKLPPSGWLAIKPPRDSFSWVNKRFLAISGSTAQVLGEDVPVRTGSTLFNGRPTTEWIKLQRGAQVIVVGREEVDGENNSIWVPIAPAPQEVRFIPADAVKVGAPPVQTVSSAPPPAPAGAGSAGAAAAGPVPAPDHPLWAQAKKAEQDGNYAEAERLYHQLAHEVKERDHELWLRCHNQIVYLKQKTQPAASVPNLTGYPAATPTAYPGASNRLVPTPAYPYQAPVGPAPVARATSQYTYTRESTTPPPVSAPNPAAPSAPVWRGPGVLTRSANTIFGQPGYALDGGPGVPVVYVTAQPGVNLEPYVGRQVMVEGPLNYHPGWRKEHVTAIQVRLQ
jgi:hypothetical protein